MIGGRPIYGARDFFEPFVGLELQNLPRVEGTSVRNKVLHLPEHVGVRVKAALTSWSRFKNSGPAKQPVGQLRHTLPRTNDFVAVLHVGIRRARSTMAEKT